MKSLHENVNYKDDNNEDNEELHRLFIENKILNRENEHLKSEVRDPKKELEIHMQKVT